MLEKILKKTIQDPAGVGLAWPAQKLSDFQDGLLAWYGTQQRRLPWRESPSLYGTVVSEFMLQQTRVSTVLPYYERWMVAFPGFEALDAAKESEVLKHWEGLGYYSRARNLHKLAKQVSAMEEIPQSRARWLEFPGVGPYASAAITSIAFDQPEAVVDGNVVRILARLFKDGREFRSSAEAAKAMSTPAKQILNTRHPGDHNQAVMELGATLCLPRKPSCLLCPVREHCLASLEADPNTYPNIRRRKNQRSELSRAFCLRDSKIFLFQHPADAPRLAGLLELPLLESVSNDKSHGLLLTKTRAISDQSICERIYRVEVASSAVPGCRWVGLGELDDLPMSGPHRSWLPDLLAMVD